MPERLIRKLVHLEYAQDTEVSKERIRIQKVIERREEHFELGDKRSMKECKPCDCDDKEVLLVNNAVSWYYLRTKDLSGTNLRGLNKILTAS